MRTARSPTTTALLIVLCAATLVRAGYPPPGMWQFGLADDGGGAETEEEERALTHVFTRTDVTLLRSVNRGYMHTHDFDEATDGAADAGSAHLALFDHLQQLVDACASLSYEDADHMMFETEAQTDHDEGTDDDELDELPHGRSEPVAAAAPIGVAGAAAHERAAFVASAAADMRFDTTRFPYEQFRAVLAENVRYVDQVTGQAHVGIEAASRALVMQAIARHEALRRWAAETHQRVSKRTHENAVLAQGDLQVVRTTETRELRGLPAQAPWRTTAVYYLHAGCDAVREARRKSLADRARDAMMAGLRKAADAAAGTAPPAMPWLIETLERVAVIDRPLPA